MICNSPRRLVIALRLFVLIAATFHAPNILGGSTALVPGTTNELRLGDFVRLVILRNESLHARVLEYEINHQRFRAERGLFEPELVLSYDRAENKRENTAEQRRSTGVLVFDEQNNIYNAGLEALVPTGAKIRLGYTLRDLRNNLQDPAFGTIVTNSPKGEFQTFAGLSVTQPLLKNAWYPSTLATMRLAALGSEVAYHEYRRQMMIVISSAEATYWNLYLAQEQVGFFRESVNLAQQLAAEAEQRVRAGKAAEIDVLEARAGLALRHAKLIEAQQKYFETAAQLLSLMSQASLDAPPILRALDVPGAVAAVPAFAESGRSALTLNPDYLAQTSRMKQEDIRVAYAKNQALPQFDLRASYGLNGLGADPYESFDDVQTGSFPSFSVGAELHIPLAGNIKASRERDAAKLRKEQALVTLKETETQILNAVDTALRKVRHSYEAVTNNENVVSFNQSLLDTERARLNAGTVSSRRVLEVDASLFEAKNSVVEAKVLSERARLELELVQGTLLRTRNVDMPQKELERRTTELLNQLGVSEAHYRSLAKELQMKYESPATKSSPSRK